MAEPQSSNELDLLHLAPGERLYRLYIFRPAAGRATRQEHHIYAKRKPDGRLALVTFVVHTPVAGRSTRSGIARVPDLSTGDLDRIIAAIRCQTAGDECEELDLSGNESYAFRYTANLTANSANTLLGSSPSA